MCHTAGWDGYPDRRLQTVWFYRTEPCSELQHCWRHLSDAWSSIWETPACLRLLCPRGPSCKNIIEHYYSSYLSAPEFSKVYLVTGGRNRTTSRMSSTEILVAGSTFWVESSPLPSPRVGLRGVNIGGDFYVIGGEYIPCMVWLLVYCQCRVHTFGLLQAVIMQVGSPQVSLIRNLKIFSSTRWKRVCGKRLGSSKLEDTSMLYLSLVWKISRISVNDHWGSLVTWSGNKKSVVESLLSMANVSYSMLFWWGSCH